MRFLAVLGKALKQHLRHWALLSLALMTAPFFVYVYHAFLVGMGNKYVVVIVDRDVGITVEGKPFKAGKELMTALRQWNQPDMGMELIIKEMEKEASAVELLRDRKAEVLLVLTENFSARVMELAHDATRPGVDITMHGDLASPKYLLGAILVNAAVEDYVERATGRSRLIKLTEVPVSGDKLPNDFDLSIPGILVLGLIMLLFTASIALIAEVEGGTVLRLRMSRLRVHEFLGAISISEVMVGVASMLLAIGFARWLGYRENGSLTAAMLVGVLACLSMIAIAVAIAGVSRTANDILIIGNFPFFLLFFFSGSAFPVPPLNLFAVAGHMLTVNELLPTTHAVAAMNKVLNLGSGLDGVVYEMSAILLLTVLYGVGGGYLFWRKHLRMG